MKKRTSNFAEMNYFLFFCCLVLGIGTAQNTEAQITAWPAPAFVDSVRNPVPFGGAVMEDAKKIYNTTCWTCHGLDGKGFRFVFLWIKNVSPCIISPFFKREI